MIELLVSAGIFFSVLLLTYTLLSAIARRREIKRTIEGPHVSYAPQQSEDLNRFLETDNQYIIYYYKVLSEGSQNSIRKRLINAGYFTPRALLYFNILRSLFVFALFVGSYFAIRLLSPSTGVSVAILVAMLIGGIGFILASAILDRFGKRKQIAYRKVFPDFMDLLIVCLDAGLSIEMALDRVAREFFATMPDFGIHVAIITVEVRAGRRLHEALVHFSERVNVEEARALATLFRQSEELGASVTRALRVFSAEMRERRIIMAEEKANQLPVKMLFPMALFMFPVSLVIVLVPILVTIVKMFQTMSPGG